MKSFKEMLDEDLERTFYNTNEFAQIKRIKCGDFDKKIPVIFDNSESESRRQLASGDNAQGIYKRDVVIRVKLSDLKEEPEYGMRFWVDGRLFKVKNVHSEYNELIIGLEGYDE